MPSHPFVVSHGVEENKRSVLCYKLNPFLTPLTLCVAIQTALFDLAHKLVDLYPESSVSFEKFEMFLQIVI